MHKTTYKRLQFADPLPELVLGGQKTTTWRVDDPRNTPFVSLSVVVGDRLSLCSGDGTEFARAVVLSITETTFGKLSMEEKAGHEKFASEKEMYDTYNRYYGFLRIPITPETKVKVLKFELET
ncbi:MAG: ASCH domain-containing protein [Candidatus Marsarchaeota archaeon]|jgi:hypothetical protein|nr:ASCH domain-containing protein [Candidatus Marsarchaeota archaeon]